MKEKEASLIANLPKVQGRKKLLELLGLSLDFSYDEELRSEIHCNLLYDSYTYSVDKGFSWKDVCIAVQLTQQLLTQTLGKTMVETTTIYKELALNSGMDNRNLAVYTDYFFSTFMQHYRLYQYVFSFERDLSRFVTEVAVEAPPPPGELQLAKTPSLHEYDQRLMEIQSKRMAVNDMPSATEIKVELDEDIISCSQTEALQRIISKVVQDIAKPMIDDITSCISTTYKDLDVKLDETALARPKQLGPPPRYQTKPALVMPKNTIPAVKTQSQTKASAKSVRGKSPKK